MQDHKWVNILIYPSTYGLMSCWKRLCRALFSLQQHWKSHMGKEVSCSSTRTLSFYCQQRARWILLDWQPLGPSQQPCRGTAYRRTLRLFSGVIINSQESIFWSICIAPLISTLSYIYPHLRPSAIFLLTCLVWVDLPIEGKKNWVWNTDGVGFKAQL